MRLLIAAAVGLFVLAGCTNDPGAEVATAASAPVTSTPATGQQKELEFVACMRSKGISDMVDPIPGDTSGRSAVKYMLDVLGKGSDMVFQAALEQCQTLLPPGPEPTAPPTGEVEKSRLFAKCMRENGAPDFPDPDPTGKTVLVQPPAGSTSLRGAVGVGAFAFAFPNPALKEPLLQCKDLLPGVADIVDHLAPTA
jgi:hypothetical protein